MSRPVTDRDHRRDRPEKEERRRQRRAKIASRQIFSEGRLPAY